MKDVGRDDDAASGTATSPYEPLLHAMIQHPPTGGGPTYMTRKSQTGSVSEDGDPSARLEWKPATKSALKKATGLYEQHKRKLAKVAGLAVREKERGTQATEGLGRS